MARVLTVTSGKGGVGKTTLSANLSVALAMCGQRVVVIDADVGLRNLDMMLGLENRIVYDLVDVIEGRCRLRQAMVRDKRLSELYLLPAAQTRDKSAVTPQDMIDVCQELDDRYDFVLIDSPAGIEQGFRYAVAPADGIIIVTNPEVAAVRDADRVVGLIEAEEKGPASLVVNRIRPDMVKRGEMLDIPDVVELLALDLLGIVPDDEQILVTANRGRPLAFSTNDSQTAVAFHNIARRLMGEDVPFQTLGQQGVFKRFFDFVRPGGE